MLERKISARSARIAVIGLGYVGLPVACEFARVGFDVIGVDLKRERIDKINAGISPIEGDEPGLQDLLADVVAAGKLCASTSYDDLHDADVITLNVETPVSEDNRPRYVALRSACAALGSVLKRGALVVIESTVAPGTAANVVIPAIEAASGMKVNEGFFVGACPERVMPGRLLRNLREISRVCGASTPEIGQAMKALYSLVTQGEVDVTDVITAELVKTAENAYRDVQIAFANEVALICEDVGADVYKVRELVNKSPGRVMLLPGAGVGGHCIPKDPWLLASAADTDTPIRLIPAARAINESMPEHMIALMEEALSAVAAREPVAAGGAADDAPRKRVLVLGYSYLEDSDDTRHSPSETLVAALQSRGYEPVVHDPWVEAHKGDVLDAAVGCDATILMVAHSAYRVLDLNALRQAMRTPVLVDGRGVFAVDGAREAGFEFRGVGR
jgi:UDP-N-acetyl-D-mannosaminuronic acid dehydrogenase